VSPNLAHHQYERSPSKAEKRRDRSKDTHRAVTVALGRVLIKVLPEFLANVRRDVDVEQIGDEKSSFSMKRLLVEAAVRVSTSPRCSARNSTTNIHAQSCRGGGGGGGFWPALEDLSYSRKN